MNLFYLECSSENSFRKVRFPLRQNPTKKCSKENLNKDKIEYLLKEQIDDLIQRQTTNIQSKRSVIKIPSIVIKHENFNKKPIQQQIDSTSMLDRYSKLQQFIYSNNSNHQKNEFNRQSPILFQQIKTLGLTVTPLEIYNSNQHQLDKTIRRPSTQPGSFLFFFY